MIYIAIYKCIKSTYCTLYTYTMLYVNCISIKIILKMKINIKKEYQSNNTYLFGLLDK